MAEILWSKLDVNGVRPIQINVVEPFLESRILEVTSTFK